MNTTITVEVGQIVFPIRLPVYAFEQQRKECLKKARHICFFRKLKEATAIRERKPLEIRGISSYAASKTVVILVKFVDIPDVFYNLEDFSLPKPSD